MIDPRWLKLRDASRYASISKGRLIQLALDGRVRGGRDPGERGDWIFDRLSLDAYREESMPGDEPTARALEIMKGVTT